MMSLGAPHLSREFFKFTKSLGEARSKQEEERIVLQEINSLKQHIQHKDVTRTQMKEYLVRAIYVDMLGFDSEFAHIHAINMAQEKDVVCKRAGYLACMQLLRPDSNLMLLLVNTIQKDLNSPNFIERCCALRCICTLLTKEMVPILLPLILQCLEHENEFVRKLALMAIARVYEFNPTCVENVNTIIERGICDQNPAVMANALNLLAIVLQFNPKSFRHLVPSLASILNQICEGRLPSTFDYHKTAAPWLQISIISLFGKLGAGDRRISEYMYEPLTRVMQLAQSGSLLIANAIVFECARTTAVIISNDALVKMASEHITAFLNSSSNNLRYAGICGLSVLVALDVGIALDNQMTVVSCLEDGDETIRRRTLELLYRMTNAKNVCTIVHCFIGQLKSCKDRHQSLELIRKTTLLCERFAPDIWWYIDTMIELMLTALELVDNYVLYNLVNAIKDHILVPTNDEFRNELWVRALELLKNQSLPFVLIQLASWLIGELASCIQQESFNEEMLLLLNFLNGPINETSSSWILTALRNVIICNGYELPSQVIDKLKELSSLECTTTSQRCREILGLVNSKPKFRLASNGFDFKDTFICDYVEAQIQNGAASYKRPERVKETIVLEPPLPVLKFEPYIPQQPLIFNSTNESLQETLEPEIILSDHVPKVWGPGGYPSPPHDQDDVQEMQHPQENSQSPRMNTSQGYSDTFESVNDECSETFDGAETKIQKTLAQSVNGIQTHTSESQRKMALALFEGLDRVKANS
ncbi:bifunctional Armadillo-type fold/Clathrin-coatomer adaptor [Babesia duncani]|uniref:Bifunctional Armadillo-type fold/Clathrin-coatomer adaptor n=1 Tax=Babesia duncani TaxID=323732 RepID=A0AAD9PLH0_9APIC|nr:bifunctional Armadillo-type fold/Clathrin-coatomer adaptor [Babesia duncani]KAK2196939.1 bifunctional Armadillo-type fold/Clathrin-coatomer adaptor [Babesia duncani]